MSASPGAYVTSLPQQTWIKLAKGRFFWYVYGTFTASTSYVAFPPWHDIPQGAGYSFSVVIQVVVTAVSGTSPTMNVYLNATDHVAFLNGSPIWNTWNSIPSSGSITSTGYYAAGGSPVQTLVAFQISISIGGTSPSFTAFIDLQVVG